MTNSAGPVRWGILGTGGAAQMFATGLQTVPGAVLAAVGSRRADSAADFARRFGVERSYGAYADLVGDPAVDVVYVATINTTHREHVLMSLDAGKAVLCEKPFAMNASESREMIAAARARQLFLMEGMWTRFLPATARVRQLVSNRTVGDVRLLLADFGAKVERSVDRLFRPDLGGGALLDRGVYLVSLASMLFGPARQVVALAAVGAEGVDEQSGVVMLHDAGRMSVLASAIRATTPREATIVCTGGMLRIHAPVYCPRQITVVRDGEAQTIDLPVEGNGFAHEAAEVHHCLHAGAIESTIMPLDESQSVMETLDRIRASWTQHR